MAAVIEPTERLLPCPNPWCDSHDIEAGGPRAPEDVWSIADTITERFRVQCAYCYMKGPGANSEAEAIQAWNTRTDPTTICNRLSDMEMVEAAAKVISEVANLSGQHMTEILARRYAQTAITVLAPLLRAQRDREIIAWLRDKAVHRGDFLYEASDELESGQVPLNKGREIDG